jgi:spermidine/putrescine transport system permease protein
MTMAVLVFLFAPLLVVIVFSFHSAASLSLPFDGFSTRWYSEVFSSFEFRDAAAYSVRLALCAAAASLVLGTITAYGLARMSPRLSGPLSVLFFIPVTLPHLFIGMSLLGFFVRLDAPRGFATVLIGQIVFVLPFFLLIVREAFVRLDPALDEAAADLGATPLTRFRRVVLPQIWPVLAAGTALSFALALDEFQITFFTIGNQSTIPLLIWSQLSSSIDPRINVISTLLLLSLTLFILVSLVIMNRGRRRLALSPDRAAD